MGSYDLINDKKLVLDHCGIVAAYSPHDIPFFKTGLHGLTILQTRGYDGAGFCATDSFGKTFIYKGKGMVNEVFTPSAVLKYAEIRAKTWIYQVRYGTNGNFIADNVQPFMAIHKQTKDVIMVAHNGQFSLDPQAKNTDVSDTYLFTQRLAGMKSNSFEECIAGALATTNGAWSLVIGTRDALYLARDPYGFRPLTYGHLWDEESKQYIWVVSSETSSLDAMGAVDIFELLPGNIAKITEKGLTFIAQVHQRERALCIFENIYIHHGAGKAHLPRSNQRGIRRSPTVDDVRRRCGKILAREAPLTRDDVDMVIGVPGTGIEGGMAYARILDIPYFQAITDKAASLTEQRTFMTADIDIIYQKVLDHFRFDAQALKNRRVVLVDDSIVRGNITRGLVYLLKHHYSVPVVHLRVVSPPIDKSCHLGVNTRTSQELIAARSGGNVENIRAALDAESLAYLSSHGLKEALTGDPNARGFCMGCMQGHMPPFDMFGSRTRKAETKKLTRIKTTLPLPSRHLFAMKEAEKVIGI